MSNVTTGAEGVDDVAAVLPGIDVGGRKSVFARLTLMMLLEFVVFGSWFATFGLVLATAGLPTIIGTAYSLAAVAAIVSPMFLGAIGDRFLSSQKALALAQLAGGVTMLFLPAAVRAGNGTLVLVLVFVYMLFFMPTLGLANSIAFRHLGANQRLFPYIRVFGTLGWVIAGLGVGSLGLSASPNLFYVTAGASILFAVYSFTLPKTPPPAKGVKFSIGDVVGAKAFALLKKRNYGVLMFCGLLTSVSLGVYNSFASPFLGASGITNVAGVLAIGQISEVVFVVTIPLVLRYVGMKWALFAGMVMWGIRFSLFIGATGGHHWQAIFAVALQGICNDFFLVLAAMYIGIVAPIELSGQAQAMLILVVSGLGSFIGATVGGHIYGASGAAVPGAALSSWVPLFTLPICTAVVTAIVWAVGFKYTRAEGLAAYKMAATVVH